MAVSHKKNTTHHYESYFIIWWTWADSVRE